MSHTHANLLAITEFEEFSSARRTARELAAQKDYIKQLEDAAKLLPEKPKSKI